MVDLEHDRILSISEAAAFLPGRPHASTLFRWMQKGVKGIRLSFIVRGGRRYVSLRALEDFLSATTAAAAGNTPAPSAPVLTKHRRKEIDAAEKFCASAGI
jgi:hypothetical protein